MNDLRTIDNAKIGDVFELLNPPAPIWRYALVKYIRDNNKRLTPFDMTDPTHFIIEDPATAGGFGLNPSNTQFVRTFEYTDERRLDGNGVLRYYHGPPPIIPNAAGGTKRCRLRKRKCSKKRGKSKKQSMRKRK
jgi:hypothetical protein